MKRKVIAIRSGATLREAAALLSSHHIGSLPVVDAGGRLAGLIQMRDLLALVLPDFIHFVEDFDFVGDFGAVEMRVPEPAMLELPVTRVMQPPVSVHENSGLLRAFSVMHHANIHDLPVVDAADRLIGIASRVDIGALLLGRWETLQGESE